MAVFPYSLKFFDYDSDPDPAPAEVLGDVYEVTWGGNVDLDHTEIKGFAQAAQAGGVAPTTALTVLGSHDGVFWFDMQLTFSIVDPATDKVQAGETLKAVRYIRGKLTTTGDPVVSASMLMCATAPFQLTLVP